jgi:hypothetical protein
MTTTATRSPLTGGRLAAVIGGGLIVLLAAMAALGGAGLQWATSKKDDAGFYTSDKGHITTSTHAIATDDLDVDGVPSGFGKIRLDVDARNGKPVFAGIAPTSDVDAYLRGSAHETLTDVDFDPFDPTYRTASGTATPARPADQGFWAVTSDGTKPLDWKVKDGNWSVVVMNADGSAGIDAGVSAGASLPFLDDVALAAWIAAAFLLALGGGLLTVGLRRGTMPAA